MVISEISHFGHFRNIHKLYRNANFESQNCILESYLVGLNDFCMFENESKFCQHLKFMTAVIRQISHFDHFLNILKFSW